MAEERRLSMLVKEAKAIAREWVAKHFQSVDGGIGAVLAGSINYRQDSAVWPDGSDIDIWLYRSGRCTPGPMKFGYRGVIVEPSMHSSDCFDDIEAILGHPHESPHLVRGEILADPRGAIAKLRLAIEPEFPKLKWVRRRMDWVAENASRKLAISAKAKPGSYVEPLLQLVLGIRNIVAMAPIATLENPTMRRCMVVARDILSRHGHDGLSDELLDILCGRDMTPEEVRAYIPSMMELYRQATTVAKTPFWARFELDPAAESMFRIAAQDMIEAGDHREAVFFVLFVHYFSHQAIQNDGTDQEKAASRELLSRTLATVGILDMAEMNRRSLRAAALLPAYREACETIASACTQVVKQTG